MASRCLFQAVALSAFKITKTTLRGSPLHHIMTTRTLQACISNSVASRRLYSQKVATAEMPSVDYDFVQKAVENSNILIVDVREPDEIKEHGKIPNSINIPLGNITTVLGQMAEKEFEQTYQKPKPTENTEIIFYCKVGRRSGMAQENAQKLGFKNVKNYLGSFDDWAAKTKS